MLTNRGLFSKRPARVAVLIAEGARAVARRRQRAEVLLQRALVGRAPVLRGPAAGSRPPAPPYPRTRARPPRAGFFRRASISCTRGSSRTNAFAVWNSSTIATLRSQASEVRTSASHYRRRRRWTCSPARRQVQEAESSRPKYGQSASNVCVAAAWPPGLRSGGSDERKRASLSHERSTTPPAAVRRHGRNEHHPAPRPPASAPLAGSIPYVGGVDLATSVVLLATLPGLAAAALASPARVRADRGADGIVDRDPASRRARSRSPSRSTSPPPSSSAPALGPWPP